MSAQPTSLHTLHLSHSAPLLLCSSWCSGALVGVVVQGRGTWCWCGAQLVTAPAGVGESGAAGAFHLSNPPLMVLVLHLLAGLPGLVLVILLVH